LLLFRAGGPTDTLARIISQALSIRLGQPVLIENKPGAGGNIGTDFVAKSNPDGYTLLMGTSGPLAINSSLYSKLSYDPIKDLSAHLPSCFRVLRGDTLILAYPLKPLVS
jgi:tripartite-type tricarboxylate transporter receptor subunit TctC